VGELSLELASSYENNTEPISGSGTGPNADRETSLIRTLSLTARYPVSERTTLMLAAPYRSIKSPKDVGGSAAKHIDRRFSGLGDAVLLGRHRIGGDAARQDAPLYVLAGLRLPTGSANPNHTWRAADGSEILSRDAVLQPGFGSWDPIVGLQWSRPLATDRTLFLGALYRRTGGTNDYGYRFGDEFQATVGASIPVGRGITFRPQLLAQVSGHDHDFRPLPGKQPGQVSNTGGRWLYFMPNFRVGSLEFDVQIPIYRKTNGNILNPKVILTVRTTADLALSSTARARRRLRQAPLTPGTGDFRVISRGEPVDLAAHAASGKITLFEFASERCAPCRSLTPELTALLRRRPDVALRQIDVTDPAAPARAQYGIEATPAFVVLDKEGAPVTCSPVPWDSARSWLDEPTEAGGTGKADATGTR
jgi:hypothetical protein